jgi:hypothetical protein
MSTLRVVHPSHPAKPVQPHLGQLIDDLFELRGLVHRAQANERAMTAEVLQALTAAGLARYEGEVAVAIMGQRLTLAPDPQLFLEALGPRAVGLSTPESARPGRSMIPALKEPKEILPEMWPLIPWRTRASALIVLRPQGPSYAHTLGEKQVAIRLAVAEGCPVLLAWTGRYSTDLFQIDDLPRVEQLVAPATQLSREHPKDGQ